MIQDEKFIKMWGTLLHKPVIGPKVRECRSSSEMWIDIHIIY